MPDFSTPAEHAFEAPDLADSSDEPTLSTSTSSLSLSDRYSIASTLSHILSNDTYRVIALQFPDELLPDSVLVYRMLMKGLKEDEKRRRAEGEEIKTERQCYVLGDSTYGSCCPDVLSSLHLPADILVHYGHACLTRTEALPVLYVFPKRELDTKLAAEALYKAANSEEDGHSENVVVLWDVAYDWLRDDITKSLGESSSRPGSIQHLIFSKINSDPTSTASSSRPTPVSGCCSTSQSPSKCGSGSGSCCQTGTTEKGNGKGKGKACGCAGEEGKLEGEMQQLGLVNQGGIQVDVTSHSNPSAGVDVPVGKTDEGNAEGKQSRGAETEGQGSFSSLRSFDFPEGVGMKDCTIFYIGEESRGVINLMMENSGSKVYQYDPSSSSAVALHTRTPRLLQKRLLALHRMYQTTTIGILVHNVGLRSSHAVVKDLRKLIRDKGRKSYTISVGRVRPEKLANFEAIGGWVLVGCREGGLIDGKEYYRPIVTPHELRLALQGEMESWKPEDWTLDLEAVLQDIKRDRAAEAADDGEGKDDGVDDDAPIFSLADGSYHMTRRYGGKDEKADEMEGPAGEGALIRRPEGGALVKRSEAGRVAAVHLAGRAFQGLDAYEGYDASGTLAPSELVDGRVGVARGYRVDEIGKEGQGH